MAGFTIPGQRPARAYRPYAVAAVGTLAVAFLVCGGVLGSRSSRTGAGLPPPPQVTTTTLAIDGSVAVADGGRTLVYSPPDQCHGPQLNAAESATRVTLTLTLTGSQAEAVRCYAFSAPSPVMVRVGLQAPLGNRELVDAVSGRTVPYLSEQDVLRPGGRLDGWSTTGGDPMSDVSTTMPYFGGPGSAVLVENFAAAGARGWLAIVQAARGGWHPPAGTVTRPVTVRGHPGLAARGAIVWSEGGRTVAVVGVRDPPGPPDQALAPEPRDAPPFQLPETPLTTAQLLAVAATLTGGDR